MEETSKHQKPNRDNFEFKQILAASFSGWEDQSNLKPDMTKIKNILYVRCGSVFG